MIKKTIIILLIVSGLSIFSYPMISNWVHEMNQHKLIDNYEERVSQYDDSFLKEEMRKAVEYNKSLIGGIIKDPFVSGSGKAVSLSPKYLELLNVDGVMGYIEIPKIKVKLPIYHGTSDEVLKNGAGHMEMTSLPVGGKGTHAVLAGHRALASASLFNDLDLLVNGDVFYIHVLNTTLAYQVDQINTVLPNDTSNLKLSEDCDLVTLVTCTPYGVNTHRLLVRGTRVPYEPEKLKTLPAPLSAKNKLVIAAASITFLVMLALILFTVRRRKKRQQAEVR